jgi:hypothetical protein
MTVQSAQRRLDVSAIVPTGGRVELLQDALSGRRIARGRSARPEEVEWLRPYV